MKAGMGMLRVETWSRGSTGRHNELEGRSVGAARSTWEQKSALPKVLKHSYYVRDWTA